MKAGLHCRHCPGADQAITLGSPPGGTQHQQQGDLGGGVAEHVRGVGDDDAARLRGFQVHVIDAHGEVRDGFDACR